MKKVIAVLMIMFMLTSCKDSDIRQSRDGIYSVTGEYFDADIISVDGNILTVEPFDGEKIKMSADRVNVYTDYADKFSTGEAVRVIYDGNIMETYPAQIKSPAEVYLLREVSPKSPEYEVCYVNHTEEDAIFKGGLNAQKMYESRRLHLPIYRFDTKAQLAGFRKIFENDLTFGSGYDEVASFDETAEKYDEEYFEENALILCYISSSSGSLRYKVKEIYNDGVNFYLTVTQVNSPEVMTCDMAGWIIFTEVTKDEISGIIDFDCVMQ